jgi:hypothetical protein
MHDETYCGFPIYPVQAFGVLEVYERQGYRSLHCPKYVVFHVNGKALEEFRLKKSALRWAKANQNG